VNKEKQRDKKLIGIMVLLLIFAVIYQHFANEKDTLSVLRQGEPAAARFENAGGNYPSYKLWDAQENFLGYGVIAGASGYGGKLSVLSVLNPAGQITKVSLTENSETPLYLNKVLATGFLQKILGRNPEQGFGDINAVSGATITSEAIIAAVQKGSVQIANEQLGMKIPNDDGVNPTWKDMAALALVLTAIICSARKIKKLRPWLLFLSVIFIGFILNNSLTFSNFVSLFSGNLPSFVERPIWYLMVPGILIITLFRGENFYCSWLCPFGAVQEGIYRSLNLFKFSPSQNIQSKVGKYRWWMLWVAAMTALIFNNAGIASYEPFSVCFDGSGNIAQWIIMSIILLMSIALFRFWCHSFCPVGLMLDFMARLQRKLKRKKTEIRENANCNHCDNASCPQKISGMSRQDKLYLVLVSIVNIIILIALLLNISSMS